MSQARVMQEVLEQQGEMLSPSLLLLEKSKICFVLSARRKRGALARGSAELVCDSSPGSAAAASEAEGLESVGESSLSPLAGVQLVLVTSAPSCFWPKQHCQSHKRGDDGLWAAPGAVGPFAAGGWSVRPRWRVQVAPQIWVENTVQTWVRTFGFQKASFTFLLLYKVVTV